MSSYHSSFSYLERNSAKDFGWIISHFDPDNGETDSYLSQDQVYSDSYNGAKRNLYGTRWNSVANVKITVIKQDGSEFTLGECREAYRWLTGNPEANWMDLYIGYEVKYRLLCTIKDVKPQKMDAKTTGLNIYCESLSPWAYSPTLSVTETFNGSGIMEINNESDDMYSFVYPKVTFKKDYDDGRQFLNISNKSIGEETIIQNLVNGEIITLDSNQLIISDVPNKKFGSTFNFVWPRLKPGVNELSIIGMGELTFEYYYPIKMGDCAQNINIVSDPICDDFGNIQVDTLPWERVSNTPTTLNGYGITDAYTKSEVDSAIAGIDVDQDFINAGSFATLGSLKAYPFVSNKSYRFYIVSSVKTVAEGQYIGSCIKIDAGEPKTLEFSNILPDGKSYYLNLDTGELTVNNIVDQTYNPTGTNAQSGVAVAEAIANIDISNIDTYTKSEIDEKLNNITTSGVDISEEELNNMLIDVLGE